MIAREGTAARRIRRCARSSLSLVIAAAFGVFIQAFGPAAADDAGRRQQVASAAPVPAAAEEKPPITRFVIALERAADFKVSTLTNPNRVVVELHTVKCELPPQPAEPRGVIRSFRGGLSGPGRSKVEIEVTMPVVIERQEIERDGKNHRLVLEISPLVLDKAAQQAGRKSLPPAHMLGASAVQPPIPEPASKARGKTGQFYKPIIVIDPGHGGDDSGAVKNGIVEKDAVLAFSKALRDRLNARGRYRVLMTRETDVFVPLDERRRFAEKHGAQLFIAVHADYAGSHARGATIYSLRESTANALRRSAKSEVSETLLSNPALLTMLPKAPDEAAPVKAILAELAQREVETTRDSTSLFATKVIEYMGSSTSLRENADREANFAVLKTAKVPAVLIELAYVTNAQDAQNLKSQSWREKVSESIATAIDDYFTDQLARLPM
jgi:N-acetylmuramoyl-L-alanine amidase